MDETNEMDELTKTIGEVIEDLMKPGVKRIDKDVEVPDMGPRKVCGYWAGQVLRIDIKEG